ncbi:MAG: glycosyltransferase family 4 protein [Clostridia bacterium]|nr:glycosyltransferase family 4 protein [Clostridia bacterium]
MKILFVDCSVDGHHIPYLKALLSLYPDSVCVLPEPAEVGGKVVVYPEPEKYKSLVQHRKWLSFIRRTAERENADTVHFLYGDKFFRFFGTGLSRFGRLRVLMTFHNLRYGLLYSVSVRRIFRRISAGVVHTDYLIKQLESMGISNAVHIEYPVFAPSEPCDTSALRDLYGIPRDRKVLLALGGTRYDKGLDLLLAALKNVKEPFFLLIAGRPQAFDEAFIQRETESYGENVRTVLRFLTAREPADFSALSDIAVLPYRRIFDGASGPLTEAVARGKAVVGPSHGSLGDLISRNELGYTFEAENVPALTEVLRLALRENFVYGERAKNYAVSLGVDAFLQRYAALYDRLRLPAVKGNMV